MNILTFTEAARAAGVARSTLYRRVKAGRMRSVKRPDGSIGINANELMRAYPFIKESFDLAKDQASAENSPTTGHIIEEIRETASKSPEDKSVSLRGITIKSEASLADTVENRSKDDAPDMRMRIDELERQLEQELNAATWRENRLLELVSEQKLADDWCRRAANLQFAIRRGSKRLFEFWRSSLPGRAIHGFLNAWRKALNQARN